MIWLDKYFGVWAQYFDGDCEDDADTTHMSVYNRLTLNPTAGN